MERTEDQFLLDLFYFSHVQNPSDSRQAGLLLTLDLAVQSQSAELRWSGASLLDGVAAAAVALGSWLTQSVVEWSKYVFPDCLA